MQLSDFDFELPPELIAQHPPESRGGSRLLHLDGTNGELIDRAFRDLPTLMRAGDVMVFNDSAVIKARLLGQKDSGGKATSRNLRSRKVSARSEGRPAAQLFTIQFNAHIGDIPRFTY